MHILRVVCRITSLQYVMFIFSSLNWWTCACRTVLCCQVISRCQEQSSLRPEAIPATPLRHWGSTATTCPGRVNKISCGTLHNIWLHRDPITSRSNTTFWYITFPSWSMVCYAFHARRLWLTAAVLCLDSSTWRKLYTHSQDLRHLDVVLNIPHISHYILFFVDN